MIKPLSHSKTHDYSQPCAKLVVNMAEPIPARKYCRCFAVLVYAVVNLVNVNRASGAFDEVG